MGWPCPNPEFPYDAQRGVWQLCVRCGRPAWSHEQSDPLADIAATARALFQRHGRPPDPEDIPDPPHMRPWQPDNSDERQD